MLKCSPTALEVLVNEKSLLFTWLQQVNKRSFPQRRGLSAQGAGGALPGAESKGDEFPGCLGGGGQPLGTGMFSGLHPLLLSDHRWIRFNALDQTAKHLI